MIRLQNNRTVALLGTVLIVLIVGALYYFLLMPKQEEVATQRMTNETTSSTIAQLKEERFLLEQVQKKPISLFKLRQILPKERDYQGIMNVLEAVEYMTVSKIDAVTFNDFGNSVIDSGFVQEIEEEEQSTDTEEDIDVTDDKEGIEGEEDSPDEAEEQSPKMTIDLSLLPEQLELVSFAVNARFESIEELMKFMRLIENGERAIKIGSVQFTEQDELEKAQNVPYPIQANFEMMTFYYEGGDE